jgi:hypothetical protein
MRGLAAQRGSPSARVMLAASNVARVVVRIVERNVSVRVDMVYAKYTGTRC